MPGIEKTMREYKKGDLRSSTGNKVTNRKQAIAIGLSSDRKQNALKRALTKER